MRSVKLRDSVLIEKFPNAAVIFNSHKRLPWALNATAAEIACFCQQRKTESEIVDYLHEIYGVTKPKLRKDVKFFLGRLKRKGMVDIYV